MAQWQRICQCRRWRFNPWVRKISPREGNGNQLQYSYLGNPTDSGAWQAIIQGVAKSWTNLASKQQQCGIKIHQKNTTRNKKKKSNIDKDYSNIRFNNSLSKYLKEIKNINQDINNSCVTVNKMKLLYFQTCYLAIKNICLQVKYLWNN